MERDKNPQKTNFILKYVSQIKDQSHFRVCPLGKYALDSLDE